MMTSLNQLKEWAATAWPEQTNPTLPQLLLVWCRNRADELGALLAAASLDLDTFRSVVIDLVEHPDPTDREVFISAIVHVQGEALMAHHLLRGISAQPRQRIGRALAAAGLDPAALLKHLDSNKGERTVFSSVGVATPAIVDSPILHYGRDLTRLAGDGAFDELLALPEELDRLHDVLLRRRKGNPILTGTAGVGKTAMVESLARDIVRSNDSPLRGYRLVELSMGKLVAGTKYRGEFESRFERAMDSLKQAEPAILFIDEIHLLLGAGRAEGGAMDGANLIKPFLARDGFRVIGATTDTEYRRYIARDEALARRFQQIPLCEPDGERLHAIVKRQAEALRAHHNIHLAGNIVTRAIELTSIHLPNRSQPDKSVDLIDSALAAARRNGQRQLDEATLLATLARLTQLPLAALSGAQRQELKTLVPRLKQRIVGQDRAIETVGNSLIQARLQIGREQRPLGVFLFAGDTGVGKTELARAIATEYFGNEQRLCLIDLAEYSGPAALHKLIGAPAGLVGYEDEGVLVRGLQRWPAGVIVFDEVEKAAPEVHKLLLGLLDNGRLTSGRGDRYDARQSIVVLTTNAMTSADLHRPGIGFTAAPGDPAERLEGTFPRELLGRLDEIVPFRTLGTADLRRILDLRLREQEERLARRHVHLKADRERLLDHLLGRLQQQQGNGRRIERLLERELLQALALALLEADGNKAIGVELGEDFYTAGRVQLHSDTQDTRHIPPAADAQPEGAIAHGEHCPEVPN